jgi:hypothetical protein
MLLRQVYIKWNWIRFFTGNDFKFMSSIDKETTGTPSSSSVNQRTTRGLIHRATNDGPAIAYCEQVVINVSYNYPPPSNVDHGASLNGRSLQRLSYFFFPNSELKSTGAQEPPQAVRDAPIPEKPAQNGACAPSHNWASSTPGTSTELGWLGLLNRWNFTNKIFQRLVFASL